MQETHSAWTLAAGLLLLTIGVLAHFYGVPELVREMVSENVALKKDSDALGRFRQTPQPLHFMVYFFHVENPEEVSTQGARPVLTEKGPYIYDMYRERVDVKFHNEDDTLSYFSKSTYHFNKDKSGCRTPNDVVTIIHVPILGTALKLHQVSSIGLGIFNDAVSLLFQKSKNIFLTASVRELLFDGVFINCSYPANSFPAGAVCQGLRSRAPASYRREGSDFYFSMFGHLNGTSTERMRVSRGEVDPGSVGRITSVRGNATLSNWLPGSPCNLVNGTDGSVFGPFLHSTTVLPIYTAASCRSLYLLYKGDTTLGRVALRRYVIDANMLASGRDYPPNRCFCVVPPQEQSDGDDEEESRRRRRSPKMSDEERLLNSCLPNGSMDLSPCSGSPVVLTFPHFYLGDPVFLDYATGLSPKEEDHETIVDLDPLTGIPLRAKKRVQLNMFLKKIEDFNYLTSVSEGLFPILWMEEGITLEAGSVSKVANSHIMLMALGVVPWLVTALGVVLVLGGLAFLTGAAQSLFRACNPWARIRVQQQAQPQQQQQGQPPALQQPKDGFRTNRATPLLGTGAGTGTPQYRMSVGFGADDLAFAQKAHYASNNNIRGGMRH